MNDTLDIIIQRINQFREKISKKSNTYFKKAVYKGEEYADKGKQHIENEKLKWKLRKAYIELGTYVYVSNTQKNILDYSDDERFILLLDKINRIRNLIKHNQGNQ